VTLANFDDFFFKEKVCAPVIGNVIVYRDANHLSNTFVKTLSPYIEPLVLEALKQKQG
jgi:hypothetical protein